MKKLFSVAVLALLMVNTHGFSQQIQTSPDSLWVSVGSGDSLARTLVIRNTGSDTLLWDLKFNFNPGGGQRGGIPALKSKTASTKPPMKAMGAPRRSSDRTGPAQMVTPSIPRSSAWSQMMQNPDENILVIQDEDAWGVTMSDFIFNLIGNAPTVINSSSIEVTDFFAYDLIITVGDQNNGVYYPAISSYVTKFEDYVAAGGVVQHQLATQGENVSIVGGVTVAYGNAEDFNRVLMPEHPSVSGLDSLLQGDWANHCYLTNLPQDALIITETQNSRVPTTAEYRFGAGTVIVTGMTWEYLYINGYNSGPMMGQSLQYALTIEGAFLRSSFDSGAIAAGDSQVVTIMIDASSLNAGEYTPAIELRSNDLDVEDSLITVSVAVTVLPPLMGVTPDSISVSYPSGGNGSTTITVNNTGLGRLKWRAAVVSSSGIPISFDPSSGDLVQGGSQQVTVNLGPSGMIGQTTATIKVTGNDPENPSVYIPLGITLEPPDIDVDDSEIIVDVPLSATRETTVRINNTGTGTLQWSIGISENEQQQTIQFQKTTLRPGNKVVKAGNRIVTSVVNLPLEPGAYDTLESSSTALTCLSSDPVTGLIYAQENYGYGFYEYNPATNQWTQLPDCPVYSGNNGGGAVLNGKVYNIYTDGGGEGGDRAVEVGGAQAAANFNYVMSVYNIADSTWEVLGTPVASGLIEAHAGSLFMADYYVFVSYNPFTAEWDTLPHPGEINANFYDENLWGGLRYFQGHLYDLSGNGDTTFAKYNLATQEWTLLPGVPGGALLGTAIDPVAGKFYAAGDYGGTNLYVFDLQSETWSVGVLPFSYVDDMGMTYVPNGVYRGIYMIQGEDGYEFARLNTLPGISWITPDAYFGSVSGNSHQDITLTVSADTLALGEYHALVEIFSNDPDEASVQIPLTMRIVSDTSAPFVGIHFFQDKYLSQYVNVISTSNEPLAGAPSMSVVLPGDSVPVALTVQQSDSALGVYYSHFKLTVTGDYTFAVSTADSVENTAGNERVLSVTTLTKSQPATLISHDGRAKLAVEPKLSGIYLTVAAEPHAWIDDSKRAVTDAYAFGPAGLDPGVLEVSFDYASLEIVDPQHLVIYRINGNRAEVIKTTIDPIAKRATAITGQLGKYQLFHDVSVVSEIASDLPKEFALKQNFPNPFNPSTTIGYALPHESKVVLTVYNVLGQEVRTLVNEIQPPGVKQVRWDGRDKLGRVVSSGVYLYRIQAGDFTVSKKMLFMK